MGRWMPRQLRRWRDFGLLGSFDRQLAALAFAGKVKTAVEEPGIAQQELAFGGWRAVVSFPTCLQPAGGAGRLSPPAQRD